MQQLLALHPKTPKASNTHTHTPKKKKRKGGKEKGLRGLARDFQVITRKIGHNKENIASVLFLSHPSK